MASGDVACNATSAGLHLTGVPNVDKLYNRVEKAVVAAVAGRKSLSVAHFRRAVAHAIQLYGDDLVAANLKLQQASQLQLQLRLDGVPEDKALANSEAWALSFSALPLILRRMEENTPRCTTDEVQYFRRLVVSHAPAPSARNHVLVGFVVGYATALDAARLMLQRFAVRHIPLSAAERCSAEAFVLRAVDLILPASRSLCGMNPGEEMRLINTINLTLKASQLQSDAFVAILRAKWMAPAMVAVRDKRGINEAQLSVDISGNVARVAANRAADIKEHGLKRCALPSCDKREAMVKQFGFCSVCRSVWYCSAEHGALHWKQHKPTCSATVATKQAASEGGAAA